MSERVTYIRALSKRVRVYRNKCAHASYLVTGLVDYHLAIVLENSEE